MSIPKPSWLRILAVIWAFGGLSAGLAGCSVLKAVFDERTTGELERQYGARAPVLEAFHAPESITPGTTWKIYLKGTDPDGDLRFLSLLVEAPCGYTPPIRLEIAPENDRFLSGYLTLNTAEYAMFSDSIASEWIHLYLALEDRAGHRSETAYLPVIFVIGESQGPPPEGVFADRFLGRIPPQLPSGPPCSPGDGIQSPERWRRR